MYYKYQYSFIYNWSKLKKIDFSGSENDFYFGTERVYKFHSHKTHFISWNSLHLYSPILNKKTF
jgi:hypothetical protein